MIACITPNVAIDRTYYVRGFADGGIFRPAETVVAAGGKGLNVARAVHKLGGEPLCAGFLGGHAGRHIADMVEEEGFSSQWTHLGDSRETRTCIIFADPDAGLTTVVNEIGPPVNADDWQRLTDDILWRQSDFTHICFSGSAPPGTPYETFAGLLQALVEAGKQVWVDASGDLLKTAVTVRGIRAKINRHEAAALLNKPVETVEDAKEAARNIYAMIGAPVVISLGSRGALYADEDSAWHARPPQVTVQSAVGSGDTLLAGLIVGVERGDSPADALRYGVAAGTANATTFGGANFRQDAVAELIEQIACTEI